LKNIYIVGDSFCAERSNPDAHWPAALAKLLNLSLQGQGYPGEGWWPVRNNLLNYIKSDQFDHTELFVICHTEPGRVLSDNPLFLLRENVEMTKKVYFTYIQSDSVSSWCVQHWYHELNKLLSGRRVIHVACFLHPEFELLEGIRILTPLYNVATMIGETYNHLTQDVNVKLAKFLAEVTANSELVQF